jgi:hypothetical protein
MTIRLLKKSLIPSAIEQRKKSDGTAKDVALVAIICGR